MRERKAQGCVDCGEKDLRVLEFDHVYGTKSFNVSVATSGSVRRLLVEMNKCEVRCANCHARATYERRVNGVVAETVETRG